MKQEFFTRNNLNRTSSSALQSLSIPGGIYLSNLRPPSPSPSLRLFSLRPRPLLSPPSRTTCSFSFSMRERRTFSEPSSPDRNFTREENFSSYPGGLVIKRAVLAYQFRSQETFCLIVQRLVLFTEVQGFAFKSLPELFGYLFTVGTEILRFLHHIIASFKLKMNVQLQIFCSSLKRSLSKF